MYSEVDIFLLLNWLTSMYDFISRVRSHVLIGKKPRADVQHVLSGGGSVRVPVRRTRRTKKFLHYTFNPRLNRIRSIHSRKRGWTHSIALFAMSVEANRQAAGT